VSFRTEGNDGTAYECGKRAGGGGGTLLGGWQFTREERCCSLDSYLYQAGPGTRQHVDLRSTTVRPLHGTFRVRVRATGTGISRVGARAPHSLAQQPRVGGAALCIIDSIFQHAVTALHSPLLDGSLCVFYLPA
jgi:hypothetical protein